MGKCHLYDFMVGWLIGQLQCNKKILHWEIFSEKMAVGYSQAALSG